MSIVALVQRAQGLLDLGILLPTDEEVVSRIVQKFESGQTIAISDAERAQLRVLLDQYEGD